MLVSLAELVSSLEYRTDTYALKDCLDQLDLRGIKGVTQRQYLFAQRENECALVWHRDNMNPRREAKKCG